MTRIRTVLPALVVLVWVPAVLVVDSGIGTGASDSTQRLLGLGTWVLLVALLWRESTRTRAQVAVVVAFATLIEYTFSYELHVYVYRLHNVPWYVPPGHGLVYLGALSIGRTRYVRENATRLIPATIAACGGYAFWGLVFNGRHDVLGVLWFGCLVWFLLRGRQPTVFVGAFVVVTYLELVGTGTGCWTWQTVDPVVHWIRMGNPPTGAAGGYGFFDAAALALAPWIEGLFARRRAAGSGIQGGEQLVVQPAVAGSRTPAVSSIDA